MDEADDDLAAGRANSADVLSRSRLSEGPDPADQPWEERFGFSERDLTKLTAEQLEFFASKVREQYAASDPAVLQGVEMGRNICLALRNQARCSICNDS